MSNITLNLGTGGAVVASDTVGAADFQYNKLAFGADGTATKVSATNPLPVVANNAVNAAATVTAFTAADAVVSAPVGDGTLVSGSSTAGSIIALVIPDGFIAWTLLVKNWVNGTIYTEASNNSTNGTDGDWVEVKGRRTGTAPGTESVVYAMVANGYYRGNGAGFTRIRARFVGGASFPSVGWTLSSGVGATFLNSGIPGGSSVIGAITQSGTWNIGSITTMPITAVTGTFFQVTQPVSIASMPTTAVTGTFFQATQPVSNAGTFAVQAAATLSAETTKIIGAVNANNAIASAVTVMQSAVAVTGNGTSLTVTGYGTAVLQISGVFVATVNFETSIDAGTTWTAISATQVGFGDIFSAVTVPGTFRLTTAGLDLVRARVTWTSGTSITINGRSTNAINASKIVKLATSTNSIGTVQMAALTKGTQGATGVSTQDLKDSGRVAVVFVVEFSPTAVAEAMLTLGVSKDGATATTTTSYVIPTGKRLRITSVDAAVENTLGTSLQRAYFRFRFAATGGALTTSPLQLTMPVAAAGTVKSISTSFNDVPDGIEYLGDGTKALGVSLQAPDWVTGSATLKAYLTVIGFEY